jgi:hypothetical protein
MVVNTKSIIYLLLSSLTLIVGYAFIRYAYTATDHFPFTQEIVLIILGTLATIFITAMLLNKQTAVEIEKEQNILHLNLKTSTYQELLNLLEEMNLSEKFTNKELVRLQFITHKLAIIASADVIKEYQSLLNTIKEISVDVSFVGDEPRLHQSLSRLTIQIRQDIFGKVSSRNYTDNEMSKMIATNTKSAMFSQHN